MNKIIDQVSKKTGIPTKKIFDILFILRTGEAVDNNELIRRTGISKNALNQAKELLSSFLLPPSQNTQLTQSAVRETGTIFGPDYKPEEAYWTFLENGSYRKSPELIEKYAGQIPAPERKYDQFTATAETTARRAGLLDFFEDINNKRLLFLGDDDFTSVAVASLHTNAGITVLDIDPRIINKIDSVSKNEKWDINPGIYDARKTLPAAYSGKFDVVITDPPYTADGIKLFVSRAIQALDLSNKNARIYICYGSSDKAKERFLPVYDIFTNSGLMVRWVFDKFNRYQGAESIGSASSLFILDITPKTKPLITGDYDRPIYTNN